MISQATLNAAIENAGAKQAAVDAAKHAARLAAYNTAAFEVGVTYYTRSIGDYNCIIKVTIASRTKCFVTTTDGERFKVKKHHRDNLEMISPCGSYSMSPMINALSTKELKTDWDN